MKLKIGTVSMDVPDDSMFHQDKNGDYTDPITGTQLTISNKSEIDGHIFGYNLNKAFTPINEAGWPEGTRVWEFLGERRIVFMIKKDLSVGLIINSRNKSTGMEIANSVVFE